MAEALLLRGVGVIQAEIVPEILPVILDPDMAAMVRERGQEHGVDYHLQSSLEEIIGENGKVTGVRISGEAYKADAVIFAVKVRPNTELARDGFERTREWRRPQRTSTPQETVLKRSTE
jgi:NADPH-dependent 2,4-dienoyl-CoA reductase/sulfur reductase-like enzyme